MQAKSWLFFWAVIVVVSLVACSPAATAAPIPTQTVTPAFTSSPTLPLPTSTPMLSPSVTSLPASTSTPSLTLMPVTVTETATTRQSCLVDKPDMLPTFTVPEHYGLGFGPIDFEQPILEFLNAGGTRQAVINHVKKPLELEDDLAFQKDLNGDGISELVIGESHLRIYTCKNGRYYTAADVGLSYNSPVPIVFQDMNQDGQLEIVLKLNDLDAVDVFRLYQILEWDGQTFQNLIAPQEYLDHNAYIDMAIYGGWLQISGGNQYFDEFDLKKEWEVLDTDRNGTQELILTGGIFVQGRHATGPQRLTKTTLMWDGKNFVVHDMEYSPAQFRFQAVQDADYAMLKGQYNQALALYQQVISSDTLDWWSQARLDYEMAQADASGAAAATPTMPAHDLTEREQLTAYAYYRIMLLKRIQQKPAEAQKAYDTLQAKFPIGKPGAAYVELASVFLTRYRESKSIQSACAAVIQYAENHATVLHYIGERYYHPSQAFHYQPKDICPFK